MTKKGNKLYKLFLYVQVYTRETQEERQKRKRLTQAKKKISLHIEHVLYEYPLSPIHLELVL